jgi:ATP-dependent DNA helicase RecG
LDGGILVTVFNNELTSLQIPKSTDLNERQIKAINYIKEHQKITNSEFQLLLNLSRRTILRELDELIRREL